MRKWMFILIAATGVSLFMLLGFGDLYNDSAQVQYGQSQYQDAGMRTETAAPKANVIAAVSMDSRAFAALKESTRQFELQRPGVRVTLMNITPEALRMRYDVQLRTGEAPDVMLYP